MASKRQLFLLNIIVEIYVKTGEPVSSNQVIDFDNELNLSSATIRNEMSTLEKEDYIYKLDSSSSRTSGRVPTSRGYKYYLEQIKNNPDSILNIKSKIDHIFKERNTNIDNIFKKTLSLINETTNTLTITKLELSNDSLKDIRAYDLNNNQSMVLIITSGGEIIKKVIDLNGLLFKDFETVINIFNMRLKNINLNELVENSKLIKEILEVNVKDLEKKFYNIIQVMFSNIVEVKSNYSGMNNLVTSKYLNVQSQLKKVFEIIENNSIWDLVKEASTIETGFKNTTVDLDVIDGISIVNKDISLKGKNKKLTIVGSKHQDYQKLFTMLDYLEKKIKE